MDLSVHARRSRPFGHKSSFHIGFTVLERFHANKKERDVDDMLYRLYQPIVWRATKVVEKPFYQYSYLFLNCVFKKIAKTIYLYTID